MNRSIIRMIHVAFLSLFGFLLAGCLNCSNCEQQKHNDRLVWATGAVKEANDLFTTNQLETMIGSPDIKTSPSEFASLFHDDVPPKISDKYTEDILNDVNRQYVDNMEWRKLKGKQTNNVAFEHLSIWLYDYYDPEELILCDIIPRNTGICGTVLFLVDDSIIVQGAVISRRCPN